MLKVPLLWPKLPQTWCPSLSVKQSPLTPLQRPSPKSSELVGRDPDLGRQARRVADDDPETELARVADLGRLGALPDDGQKKRGRERGEKCPFHGAYSTQNGPRPTIPLHMIADRVRLGRHPSHPHLSRDPAVTVDARRPRGRDALMLRRSSCWARVRLEVVRANVRDAPDARRDARRAVRPAVAARSRRARRCPPRTHCRTLADLPPEQRAVQVVGGSERTVAVGAAHARGLTVVDLSDAWVPSVIDDHAGPKGATLVNPYHAIYVGLAADRTDGDGQPLAAGERNYLELYGIPPSLSVLRRRFLEDARRDCAATFDPEKLLAVDEVRTWGASTEAKELAKQAARGARLEAARVAAGAATLEALAAADPRTAKDVKERLRFLAERSAFAEAEKRLVCEGLLDPVEAQERQLRHGDADRDALVPAEARGHGSGRHQARDAGGAGAAAARERPAGAPTRPHRARHARRRLCRGWQRLRRRSPGRRARRPDLSRCGRRAPPRSGSGDALAGRGAADAGDRDARGRRGVLPAARARRFQVAQGRGAAAAGARVLRTGDGSLRRDRPWRRLVRLPVRRQGAARPAAARALPDLHPVRQMARGEGSARALADHRRGLAAGARLRRAGVLPLQGLGRRSAGLAPHRRRAGLDPPSSSPLASFVKEKRVNGIYARVTNYDETGPGYLSAYGLAAAIHEEMRRGPDGARFFDNGIRTHGSFDYLSLRGRFSHGCHRLYNQQAMRLFSFVLGHRKMRVVGSVPLGFRRTFYSQGEVFEMRLPSRGFYYELDPPLPVDVLAGTIKGTLQKPIAGYVPKPGVKYASSKIPTASTSPDSRAGGDAP